MKKCTKCSKLLPFSFFNKNRKNKFGLRSDCRACQKKKGKIYRSANAEKLFSVKRDWAKNNAADIKKRNNENYRAFPERQRTSQANYKARKLNLRGELSPRKWLEKCEFFGWRCYLCGNLLDRRTATIDHRKPLIKGGENFTANVAPCCLSCNSSKKTKLEKDYRKEVSGELKNL